MELANFSIVIPQTKTTKRNELLKELYALYTSQPEKTRAENKKRYYEYLRLHDRDVLKKANFTKERWDAKKELFKKTKEFIKVIPENRFWFFFSHCDTDALEKVISEARDMLWRDKNVAGFIMGQVIVTK